jgi:uncharacterized protein (TIGR02453 family)
MAFSGFPSEAILFYEGLVADNSRTYWQANKPVFERAVRQPMNELLAELAEFGPFHVFRPHKDVRFSKDKTPYKDHIGAYGESQGGAGYYVQFSASGLLVGAGYYQMASDQLDRFRRAVHSDVLGSELTQLCSALATEGFDLGAIGELKTAPRGYPRDHPRIEILRRKGLIASRQWKPAGWFETRALIGKVRTAWCAADDMNAWLDTHVGPSTLAPDDGELARFGPL